MKNNTTRFSILAIAAALAAFPATLAAEDNPSDHSAAGGRIAYQYVGRASLNFVTGTGVIYGYFTHLNGVPAGVSLFRGTPGETNALLTFRANITFQPLPGNGDIGGGLFAVTPILVTPGDFQVYSTAIPNHVWNDPSSFSNGQVIATFAREPEQFSVLGAIAINAASATLRSSARFSLDGQTNLNLRDIVPNGVTDITTGPTVALPGSTPTAPIFAFAGYALTIGN
jgi:hypothetical protein